MKAYIVISIARAIEDPARTSARIAGGYSDPEKAKAVAKEEEGHEPIVHGFRCKTETAVVEVDIQ